MKMEFIPLKHYLAAKSTKSTRCWRSSAPPSPAPC